VEGNGTHDKGKESSNTGTSAEAERSDPSSNRKGEGPAPSSERTRKKRVWTVEKKKKKKALSQSWGVREVGDGLRKQARVNKSARLALMFGKEQGQLFTRSKKNWLFKSKGGIKEKNFPPLGIGAVTNLVVHTATGRRRKEKRKKLGGKAKKNEVGGPAATTDPNGRGDN